MRSEVQWFISGLVENALLEMEEALELSRQLGEDCDLTTYAQSFLEQASEGLDQEQVESLVDFIQQLADYSAEQAQNGSTPALFAEHPPAPEQTVQEQPPAPEQNDREQTEQQSSPRKVGASKLPKTLSRNGASNSEVEVQGNGFSCFDRLDSLDARQTADAMKSLLLQLNEMGASDLHISANSYPFIRRNLKIERISDRILTAEQSEKLNLALLDEAQKERFLKEMDMNFALEFRRSRYRVALMFQKDGISGSYRLVPGEIRTLEELGFLPKDIETIERLMDFPNGLVLVTGPISSGKTTTLAALIDIVNRKREDHVISVEDPIEIVQESRGCQITQRQLHDHTESYSAALRGALRQDPDIIVIGEMFDLETIENAISAAETGHLVIGTLHTCDAANTMNRLLDVFPPTQQPQIRAMTAGSLRGIICQQLIPAADGNLTLAYEILINTLSVGSVITEGKNFKLKGEMQIGQKSGMCTLDHTILEKYKLGAITYETAMHYVTESTTKEELNREMAMREAKKLAAAAAQNNPAK